MERPNSQLEKDLNGIGIYTLEGTKLEGENLYGVWIEIPTISVEGFTAPDFRLRTISPRGVKVDYGEWEIITRDGANILRCAAFMPLPPGVKVPTQEEVYAQTFMDVCWKVGIEPVEAEVPVPQFALAHACAGYRDLGWSMPARFIDHFIDSMGKLNDVFFDGALSAAVIYGAIRR